MLSLRLAVRCLYTSSSSRPFCKVPPFCEVLPFCEVPPFREVPPFLEVSPFLTIIAPTTNNDIADPVLFNRHFMTDLGMFRRLRDTNCRPRPCKPSFTSVCRSVRNTSAPLVEPIWLTGSDGAQELDRRAPGLPIDGSDLFNVSFKVYRKTTP